MYRTNKKPGERYARRVSLLTATFQPVSDEIPADFSFDLLSESLVDRHHHARVEFFNRTTCVGDLKLRDR